MPDRELDCRLPSVQQRFFQIAPPKNCDGKACDPIVRLPTQSPDGLAKKRAMLERGSPIVRVASVKHRLLLRLHSAFNLFYACTRVFIR